MTTSTAVPRPRLELKKHALTAISYMLPLVVASGLLIAIGNLTGGTVIEDYTQDYTWQSALLSHGVLGMGLLPSVISAAIAYSIADRPGIAPGLLIGMIAASIGAGFLGGMLGGFLVGWVVLALRRYLRVPVWAEGLMPMMIIPLISTLIVGLLMFFVIGVPIVWATDALTGMQGQARLVFGAILGGMAAFDFGGPVNKTASLFADGLLLEGVQEPEAVKVLASMVPPFGVGISFLLSRIFRRNIYTRQERDNIKIALPMGVCMITEGVIPIAAADVIRVVVACTSGAAVGGALSMWWGIGSPVPSGGLFIVPAMTNPFLFLVALAIGSTVTGLILFAWKKKVVEDETPDAAVALEEEKDIDLSELHFS